MLLNLMLNHAHKTFYRCLGWSRRELVLIPRNNFQTLHKKGVVVCCSLFFLLLGSIGSNAQSYWVERASWSKSGAYKECGGFFFETCWFDTDVYTSSNTVKIGDLIKVYNAKSRKEIAKFNVKGINYDPETKRCWIAAKDGRQPDTYLTAMGCR